jgi:hypothetical protein
MPLLCVPLTVPSLLHEIHEKKRRPNVCERERKRERKRESASARVMNILIGGICLLQ